MLSNKVLPTSMTICLPMKELASSLPRKAKSSPTSSSSPSISLVRLLRYLGLYFRTFNAPSSFFPQKKNTCSFYPASVYKFRF